MMENKSDFNVVEESVETLFEINTEGEFILKGEVIAIDKEVTDKILNYYGDNSKKVIWIK